MTKLSNLHFVHSDINHRTLTLYKAMPNKCLKNVSKWGYHENNDISGILKNYQKSFWILKEGCKGYIL
jgi:hypothetical protein